MQKIHILVIEKFASQHSEKMDNIVLCAVVCRRSAGTWWQSGEGAYSHSTMKKFAPELERGREPGDNPRPGQTTDKIQLLQSRHQYAPQPLD